MINLDEIPVHRPEDVPDNKVFILWFLYVPVCCIICIAGMLGNILSLLVWKRLRNKSRLGNLSTTTYFMTLSFVDIGVLFTSILVMVLPYADESLFKNRVYAVFFSYVGHPLHFLLIFVSIYMVVGMCIDRVRLVIRPFTRYSQNTKYTCLTIGVLAGISFFLNVPTFFEFRPRENEDGSWQLTEIRYQHRREFRDAVFATHCIGVVVIPWLIMFISNALLICKSSRRLKNIRSMVSTKEERDAEHRQLTLTLILVTTSSLLLLSVQCIARCITMFYFKDNIIWPKIHFGREIGNLTLPLNSALNILLFCFPGKKFRKELKITVKQMLRRSNRVQPRSSITVHSLPYPANFESMPRITIDSAERPTRSGPID